MALAGFAFSGMGGGGVAIGAAGTGAPMGIISLAPQPAHVPHEASQPQPISQPPNICFPNKRCLQPQPISQVSQATAPQVGPAEQPHVGAAEQPQVGAAEQPQVGAVVTLHVQLEQYPAHTLSQDSPCPPQRQPQQGLSVTQ